MNKRLSLALILVLCLLGACSCTSFSVRNKTDRTVFVNFVDQANQLDEPGYLIPAGDSVSEAIYGMLTARVRDMEGQTLLYQDVPGARDSSLDVNSLSPLVGAPPLGAIYIGQLGPLKNTHLEACQNGHRASVPLFGMVVTVENQSSEGFVVSIAEYPNESVYDWRYGSLLPAHGAVQVYESVTNEPWLRVFDQRGRLAYTQVLPQTERTTALIPSTLPSQPGSVPAAPYDNDCGLIRSLETWAATGLGLAIVAVALVFALRLILKRRAITSKD